MKPDPVGTIALLKVGDVDAQFVRPLDPAEVLLGRDPASHVVLGSRMVSRRHARIIRQGDEYRLEDLRSTGGTWLNGIRIQGATRLRDGDLIRLGDCLLAFHGPTGSSVDRDPGEATIIGERDASGTAERGLIDVRAEEKLSAILDIGRALAGTLDLQEVLDRTLETLFRIFPQAQRGFVLMRNEDEPEPRPRAIRTHGDAPQNFAFSRTVFDHVVGRGKAVLCTDIHDDARFSSSGSVEEAQMRTMICAPLRDHRNRPVGLLQLDTQSVGERFRNDDLDLLAAVAGPVGVAIDNARLLQEAGQRQRRLEFLAEVGSALSSSLDFESTLSGLAKLVVPYLADLCLIDLIAEDGTVRRVAARHADPLVQPLAEGLIRRDSPGAGGLAATPGGGGGAQAEPVEVDEATLAVLFPDPDQRAIADRLAIRSHLGIPLAVHGRLLGVVSLLGLGEPRRHDPADRALAEEVARRAALAVDVARMYEVARVAREEAESANRAKDRFLAVLSHELRTPLTPVLITVSSLLEGDLDAELRPMLSMIRRNVELEARLIDDLLDLTRIARGELRIERRPADAHEVIRQSIDICREALEAAGLALEVELAAGCHRVEADPDRIQQVVWNLIQNAVKFTHHGGIVTVRSRNEAHEDGGAVPLVVEVRDTGIGIEADRIHRIFEAFQQGDAPPQVRARGLGLGLTISRSLAEFHGGTLTAASDGPGRGSTFTLLLPTISEPAGIDRRPAPQAAPDTAPALHILLVEDNRDTLNSLSRALRAKGHRVTTAADCASAREAIRDQPPDLLLSDIELPDGSGLELMRAIGDSSAIRGIAMSGYGTEEDIRQSARAGFSEHLTKPVTVAVVEAAIRRSAHPRPLAAFRVEPEAG